MSVCLHGFDWAHTVLWTMASLRLILLLHSTTLSIKGCLTRKFLSLLLYRKKISHSDRLLSLNQWIVDLNVAINAAFFFLLHLFYLSLLCLVGFQSGDYITKSSQTLINILTLFNSSSLLLNFSQSFTTC